MTPSIDVASAWVWYNQRRRRWIWSIPFSLGLCCFFSALLLRSAAEDPIANEAASRAALMALAPIPLSIEDDAWEDLKLANTAMVGFVGKSDEDPTTHIESESTLFGAAAVQTYWTANSATIVLIHQGSQKPRCSLGVNYAVLPWDANYGGGRASAKLLAVDARCRARLGDHVGAAKSIQAILRLARQVEHPPCLLNGIISISYQSIAYSVMQGILIFDTPTTLDDLTLYRQALLPLKNVYQRMSEITRGERAFILWNWDATQAKVHTLSGLKIHEAYPLVYGADRRCFVAVMNELLAMFSRNEILSQNGMETLIERNQTGPAPITRTLTPYFQHYVGFMRAYETEVLTDAALAFLQYRVKHGRDAKALTDLIPEFLSVPPTGATAGQLVRMRAGRVSTAPCFKISSNTAYQDKSWIQLYATGYNRVDDGGKNNRRYAFPEDADDTSVLIPLGAEAPNQKEQR